MSRKNSLLQMSLEIWSQDPLGVIWRHETDIWIKAQKRDAGQRCWSNKTMENPAPCHQNRGLSFPIFFSSYKKKCLIPQANQEFEWSFTKDKTLPMYIGCLHCTYRIYSTLLPPPNNAFLMKIFSLLFLFQTSNKVLVFLNSWASIWEFQTFKPSLVKKEN